MPLGANRITLLAFQAAAAVEAEVIRKKQGIVGNGSIAIDTAQSYFGGSSVLSTGSADSLLFDGSLIPLSGDFTIESWVRFTGTASRKMLYSQYTTGTGRTSMEIGTDEKASFFCASQSSFQEADRILGDSALSVDTWYHIAVVRNGSTFTMYIDGVAQADTISHSVNVQDQDFEIFGDDFGSHTDDVHQDEFRISDTARYTSGFTPSTTPFVNDDNTLLLLHCDGSDGSTHFEDDNGPNGRTRISVSATGDAVIDTAQYKFGGSSAEFPGTNGMLEISSAGNPSGTGDFTLEFWVRLSDQNRFNALYDARTGNPDNAIFLYYDNRGASTILNCTIAGSTIVQDTTTGIADNTWTHIAVSRSGSNVYLFMNGTLVDTGTNSTDLDVQSGYIGLTSFNSGNDFLGHIDEFRTSSVARYTSGFTPSTTPFVNDSNTLCLLHFDGVDGSTNILDDSGGRAAVGLSGRGNAQIDTASSVFGGSSLLLDGTGDWVTTGTTNNTAADNPLRLIESSWTMELWMNPVTDTGSSTSYVISMGVSGNAYDAVILYRNIDNQMQISWKPFNGSDPIQTLGYTGTVITNNTWNHIVMQYDQDAAYWSVYINGTRVSHQAITYTGVKVNATGQIGIGGLYSNGALPFNQGGNGRIDEVRLSNTARYSGASITVPTAPFVNDSDTMLLAHFDGTDGSTLFLDDNGATRSRKAIQANGSIALDTAQSKYGGSSLESPTASTSDYLLSPDHTDWDLGSGPWTIEFWFRMDGGTYELISAQDFQTYNGFGIGIRSNNRLLLTLGNGTGIQVLNNVNNVFTTDVWTHAAFVNNGSGTVSSFVDGVRTHTTASGNDIAATSSGLYIGRGYGVSTNFQGGPFGYNGHLDEIRISDTARYDVTDTTITVPTAPFQNDANTLLLLHMDGTDGSTDFVDDNGKEST